MHFAGVTLHNICHKGHFIIEYTFVLRKLVSEEVLILIMELLRDARITGQALQGDLKVNMHAMAAYLAAKNYLNPKTPSVTEISYELSVSGCDKTKKLEEQAKNEMRCCGKSICRGN